MSRVKVAHIANVDMALAYLLANQLRSIREADYEVVGVSAPGPQIRVIEEFGIRHIPVELSRYPFAPLQDLKALWQLYRICKREQFTIVHTHNPKPELLGQLAARLAGIPIRVHTFHGLYIHDHMHPVWRRFLLLMEKIGAQCANVVLSQNREDMRTAIREGICPADKIKYLGNGIDLESFDPDRLSPATVDRKRTELNLPAGARVVGFVGRLAARRKGFLDFLAAGHRIVQEVPDTHFVIVGDTDWGKPDAVDPATAKDYGIWERCRFLGWQPNAELPVLLALMDVLSLPSLFEGVPRCVMEASAMGVPAVVSNVKGNREAVQHGGNGLLVPWGDVPALAEAIVELLTDRDRARRMGDEGRRIAREHFDERLVFEKVKAEYARLLGERRLPVPVPDPRAAQIAHGRKV